MSKYWIDQIERATKKEADWVKRARDVEKRYADERPDGKKSSETRFNILWSNTEVLRPSLISATPNPEIRPRYRKKDPVARIGAKILERAIEFSLDQYDFVKFGKRVVQDFLLPGRGVARVVYKPTFEKKEERIPLKMVEEGGETVFKKGNKRVDDFDVDEEGPFVMESKEEVVFEDVYAQRVPWKWFRCDPDASCWEDCKWIAFGELMDRDEGIKKYGKRFLDVSEEPAGTYKDKEMDNQRIVWEVWDKRTRKRLFTARGLDKPLKEDDDPLGLVEFFPMPEPIYSVIQNDTLTPTPEFCLWQDQADELDRLSERISKVTDAIKARGAYAGDRQAELSDILDADDNQLVPIADWMAFIDKGGLDGMISWVPIEVFAKVLQILEQERSIKIQEIYELTGVSDILRGATDPRETAKAQTIKERTGSRRLLTKQDAVHRFFRDIFRIKAEIIAEQFDPATLKLMVGLENQNELFDEAVEMIKSDVFRAFNIDIETDSTIAADEQKEKEGLAEAMQATAGYVQSMFPLVQMGAIPMPVAMEILRDYFRKFRFGRRVDDMLEEFSQQQPPNPDQQEQQQKNQEMQAEMQKMQAEMEAFKQKTQIELQALQQKAQIELQKKQAEIQQDQEKHVQDRRQEEEAHDQSLRHDEELNDVKVENTKELGEAQVDVKRRQAQINQSRVQE